MLVHPLLEKYKLVPEYQLRIEHLLHFRPVFLQAHRIEIPVLLLLVHTA